jgi:MHS family proline/betaine transporter-like MFS transporter
MSAKPSRAAIWNACLGNLFEHYDTALFGFLSPFLAPLIFPEKEPLTALMLTYAIIPLGMLARPLGSLVFGYIGDVYGRGRALFLTLAGMSVVSLSIAFSPTYLQAGIWAPILFCLGRVLQNFLAAGQTMGGAIFLLENSSEKRHDLLSSLYGASTVGGLLLASLGVFLIGHYNMTDPGWRLLYLFGCLTALFGALVRRAPYKINASIKFSDTVSHLKSAVWAHRKPLFSIAINAGFSSATYSIALILMNGLIPLVSTLSKTDCVKINTYLLAFDFCALPFFGWVASKVPRERLMLAASLGVVLFAFPLILSLEGATLANVILVRTAFVLLGVAFSAPFHAWAQQMIPQNCRYAILSLSYALGTQLLGSPTAALSLWCFQKTGLISSVAWYWVGLAAASSLILAMTQRSRSLASS